MGKCVCCSHGSRCCFLCFYKWTNMLCFGWHHTKVICILHCMMRFFQINSMLFILWIFFHLPRKHCDISDAITDLHTWNISPSMEKNYILLLCTNMITTCILDIFTIYTYTLKLYLLSVLFFYFCVCQITLRAKKYWIEFWHCETPS